MLDLVERCLASAGISGLPERLDPERIVCLDASNGRIDGQCFLLFAVDSETPLLVAKTARSPVGMQIFRTEYATLEKLHEIGMNDERMTTPVPMGIWSDGELLVALQSALGGTLLKNVPGKELFSESAAGHTLDDVLAWWRRLQHGFGVERKVLDEATYEAEIMGPIDVFRRRFIVDEAQAGFLDRRFDRERRLLGLELPFMARHGDFCAANMVHLPSGIGVFDWEWELAHELPLFDLFFFFSSVRFPYTGYRGESEHFDSFISVFWGDNYFNRAVSERLVRVCAEFDIATDALGDLLVLSLIQVANLKYEALLVARGIEEAPRERPSDEEKLRRWEAVGRPDKNVPFARIKDGALENLSYVARNGLPDLT